MHMRHFIIILAVTLFAAGCTKQATPEARSNQDSPITSNSYGLPTDDQKLWALATCAVLTESNQGRHDLLGGCEHTPENAELEQRSLAKWWGITNRASFLAILDWIEKGGHRQQFERTAGRLSLATPEQIAKIRTQVSSDPETSNAVEIAMEYKDEFGAKSITAWDFDRYIALCGFAYIAGYISEDEAWQKIMPAARLLQKTFASWKELGKNHVVGREYWSLEETQRKGAVTRQCYEKLLVDPSSPWVRLKWDMDLTPSSEAKAQK